VNISDKKKKCNGKITLSNFPLFLSVLSLQSFQNPTTIPTNMNANMMEKKLIQISANAMERKKKDTQSFVPPTQGYHARPD